MGRSPKFFSAINGGNYPRIEKSKCKISSKNRMELRTGKNYIIRILLECLKFIIHETNIVFHVDSKTDPDNEFSDNITISQQNTSESVAVNIQLDGDEFEHYFCDKKTVIGVNVVELFKVIKSVEKDDIIFLYVEDDNTNNFFISTENSKTRQVTKTLIQTIENEDEGLEIPDLEFDMTVEIPSSQFQKICKDFKTFKVKKIEINALERKIIISSNDSDVKRNVILQANPGEGQNDGISINDVSQNYIYKGVFILSYFEHFTKATPLCDKVTLFLKNDAPLMIQYKVVNVGEMRFLLTN